MNNRTRSEKITAKGHRRSQLESLHHDKHKLYLGIDVGSTSSDVVVVDDASRIIYSDYKRTRGRPIETARGQLRRILKQVNPADITLAVATGTAGRFLSKLLDIPFVNEVCAQATAICKLYPQFPQATIIEMGGQDSKLIFLSSHKGQTKIRDFALNTVCAAGTGSFLDQQAQRLGINIEGEFGQMALQSRNVPRMAGRCSVFAKSDMIHLQQQATPAHDIIAGLCLALARNLKSNLGCGREFIKPVIFTGGVAANIGVVRAMEEVLELPRGELVVPDEHFFTGAIGSVLAAREKMNPENNGQVHIERIDDYLAKRGSGLENAPRRAILSRPSLPTPKNQVYSDLLSDTKLINAYLGVDVGSISTNVVVADEHNRVLAKAYLMTAGNPLEAVRRGLDIVGNKVVGKVNILGAATTGSGRYLTGDFIGADVVVNEITAQAAGATIVNPNVDTIFEIGGQDSKYISLENGVVVDFEMNHACAAGTGSFLEEQAQRLGINIKDEFAELAFASKAPIKLGERCTVFIESDLLSYQQQGAQTSDLVAGLSYSIVANYLNRVVGRRKIGSNICFQGGTAFNKAVLAAFEEVTGKEILVPDHHEVTGALGAAAISAEHMKKNAGEKLQIPKSNFRGFENLVAVKYSVESFGCEHCSNHCEIKKVKLPGSEPFYYGSRCDRYDLKKNNHTKKDFDAFEYRRKKLLEFAGLNNKRENSGRTKAKIGIPMALVNLQLLPMFAQFFKALGFEVVLSRPTDKKTIRKGVESVTAQPCFPVKVAFGHIAELIERGVDYIFLPSIVSMTASYPENEHNQLCPYVQSLVYQAKTAFANKLRGTKILTAPLRLGEGQRLLEKSFCELGEKLGLPRSAVVKAIRKGMDSQVGFQQALKKKGAEILRDTKPEQKLFVLISRPYIACDEGVNLQLPKKLAELGVKTIPMDMLDLNQAQLGDKSLHKSIYWSYGQEILRAAEIIKDDSRLFGIYLSNFGCGPDSFLQTFFRDIMSQKPCLQLELDEHSADAGVITRIEAFLDSLKHYRQSQMHKKSIIEGRTSRKSYIRRRKLYIPYMSDCSYGMAACFRAHGQRAEVMPIADEAALLRGRQFTTGKECLPCVITAGDILNVLQTEDADKVAFFMPGSNGPCRFGMYNCLHKLILRDAGASEVAVISPNQDGSFYREFAENADGVSTTTFMKDMWSATVGIDLMQKIILTLRPFARDIGHAQDVYNHSLSRWVEVIEKKKNESCRIKLMDSIAEDFSMVELDSQIQKPKIGVVGEIYVRNHPFANKNIIRQLEELGAVCDLASLAEWVYYTNFTRSQMAKRRNRLRMFLTNRAQNYFQKRIEAKLAAPLEKRFGRIAEGSIEGVIELGNQYLHQSFEGEAILSVGKIIEHHHRGAGGVVNVMPFGCMPSTIVSAQTTQISANCDNMPILNLSFDGQDDSTLTTRLEAFVEQIRQRQTQNISTLIGPKIHTTKL
ncbi:MAG: CoA activase [Planctomycetes bacterium]|nr:CoA activase [Planctomycetota bacterium]